MKKQRDKTKQLHFISRSPAAVNEFAAETTSCKGWWELTSQHKTGVMIGQLEPGVTVEQERRLGSAQ